MFAVAPITTARDRPGPSVRATRATTPAPLPGAPGPRGRTNGFHHGTCRSNLDATREEASAAPKHPLGTGFRPATPHGTPQVPCAQLCKAPMQTRRNARFPPGHRRHTGVEMCATFSPRRHRWTPRPSWVRHGLLDLTRVCGVACACGGRGMVAASRMAPPRGRSRNTSALDVASATASARWD